MYVRKLRARSAMTLLSHDCFLSMYLYVVVFLLFIAIYYVHLVVVVARKTAMR